MAKEEVRRDSPVLEEPRRLPPLLRGRRAGADGGGGVCNVGGRRRARRIRVCATFVRLPASRGGGA
jgi:hypothetical protein